MTLANPLCKRFAKRLRKNSQNLVAEMCGFFAAMAAMKFSDGTIPNMVQHCSSAGSQRRSPSIKKAGYLPVFGDSRTAGPRTLPFNLAYRLARTLYQPAFSRGPATRSQRLPEQCKRLVRASTLCSPNQTLICDRSSGTASVCSLLTRISHVGRQQGRKDCRNSANASSGPAYSERLPNENLRPKFGTASVCSVTPTTDPAFLT